MTGTADNPGAGLINGTIKTGSAITSGISGYMMGLPNLSRTGATALLSAIYVNNDGQAGFLLAPLAATFTSNAFHGTGVAVKYPAIASTSFTPSTLSPIILNNNVPVIGNLSIYSDNIYVGCSAGSCQGESRGIAVNGGGIIGVWGGYSQSGTYYNDGGITSFAGRRFISYDSINKISRYSENLSGIVDTVAQEVSMSGDFLYLSPLYKGTTTLNHFGYYGSMNFYTSISSGTFQLLPMAFANELSLSLSGISGIMGSTASLWTTAPSVTMIGTYSGFSGYNVISGGWESKNYLLGSGTLTNDGGGAYKGFLNTHLLLSTTNTINTDALALYADTSGNIGVLRGSTAGSAYSAQYGFKAEGSLNRIAMTGTADPNTLYSITPNSYTGANFSTLAGPARTMTALTSEGLAIPGALWGVGQTHTEGTYSGDPRGDVVVYSYDVKSGVNTVGTESVVGTQISAGTSWTSSGGYFQSNIAGASANWQAAATFVLGGRVQGTFDASNWSATTLATKIETTTFVNMAADWSVGGGRDKLASLNIPGYIVGSVNMSLSGGDPYWNSLNINNMGFYASTSGAKPQIWASNNVTGTLVSVAPTIGANSVLAGSAGGSAFTANFVVNNWSGGKWGANITNGIIAPALNTATKFQGGAAGAITGNSISGTASGVAH
jgi:hypothetical protein